MSGQLRTLRNRIRSVESTKKITRAMEMVSAAKMHRYQDMMAKGRSYAEQLEKLLKRLGQNNAIQNRHPFLSPRPVKKTGLVLITSDTGLCGSYNTELINQAREFLKKENRDPKSLKLIGVGKFGVKALQRFGFEFYKTFTDTRSADIEPLIKNLRGTLEELYLKEEVDTVQVIYSHFVSSASYKHVVEKLLPLEEQASRDQNAGEVDYLFEPNAEAIFARLIPLFFEAKVRQIFLEAYVSEQIARMQAMHLATENATDMIDSLVLMRNKARQASITKELIEIVSGSLALKGK